MHMERVFTLILMDHATKEIGSSINSMDLDMKLGLMDHLTKETLNSVRKTDMVILSGLTNLRFLVA